MVSIAVNSSTWTPQCSVSLENIHAHEQRVHDSCADGHFGRFLELTKETIDVRPQHRGRTAIQHRLDLLTTPDWSHTVTLADGSLSQYQGKSFLHAAVMGGSAEIVSCLADLHVENGVTLNGVDTLGRTPFKLACSNGDLECAQIMWVRACGARSESSVAMRDTADETGQTPFHAACEAGCCALVVWLYELGANFETPAPSYFSLFESSDKVTEGSPSAVALIRVSPLVCTTLHSYTEITKLLLEWGANRQATAELIRCTGDGDCPYDSKVPLEIARLIARHPDDGDSLKLTDHAPESLVGLFKNNGGPKRQRRETPVKARAENVGVQPPPTPAGVRSDIKNGSPNMKTEARHKLQKHKKACQQKVERAELAADPEAPRAKRHRALRADANSARMAKKKPVDLGQARLEM